MGDPVFVRRDPATGLGIFNVDGAEVGVSLEDSAYARQIAAAGSLAPQATAPAARPERAPIVFDEPLATIPMPQRQPPARDWLDDVQPFGRADVKLSEPTVITRPGDEVRPSAVDAAMRPTPPAAAPPPVAPPTLADVPPEWFAQPNAHAGAIDPLAQAAREIQGADPTQMRPQGPAPTLPPVDPSTVFRPPTPEDYARTAGGGGSVVDATGGAGGGAPRARAGGGGMGRAPAAPAPPTLDDLMVPHGVAGPGLYGAMVDDMAGGPAGLREQQRLGQWQTDLEQQRADVVQQAAEDAQSAQDASERRRMELEQERQQAMGTARQRYDNALRRVQSMQIDPSRFFRSGSGFGTVGAALAVGLGAIGSTIAGRDTNDVLPIIQRAIDNDIDAQRANLANAQSGLDGEMNLLREMGQEFQSREAAEQAAKAAMLAQAEARAQALLAGVASEEVQQRGQVLTNQLREAHNAAQSAAVRAEEDHEMERALQMSQLRMRSARAAREERRAMGGGGARPAAPTSALMDAFNRMVDSGATPEAAAAAVRLDPAIVPPAGRFNEPTNTEAIGTVAALSSALDGLEAMLPPEGEDIAGIGMTGSLPDVMITEQGAAIRQQVESTVEMLGRLHSGAAISDEEFARFSRVLGTSRDDRLRQGIRTIRAELGARANRRIEGNTRGQRVDQQTQGLREVTE